MSSFYDDDEGGNDVEILNGVANPHPSAQDAMI
jgi:hypothetical protein